MLSRSTPAADDAGGDFPKIGAAVTSAMKRCLSGDDVEGTVVGLTDLIRELQAQVKRVTAARDEAIKPLLTEGSARALSKRVGLSRQRIDQLAKAAQPSGRPIKRPGKKS